MERGGNQPAYADSQIWQPVQKQKRLTDEEVKYLRKKKLIEGRRNNLFLSKSITKNTGNVGLKSTYVKNKSFDDDYFRRMIIQYIEKFGSATRAEIDVLLMDKLSNVLSEAQKRNKITNLLSYLRIHNIIMVNEKKKWVLVL